MTKRFESASARRVAFGMTMMMLTALSSQSIAQMNPLLGQGQQTGNRSVPTGDPLFPGASQAGSATSFGTSSGLAIPDTPISAQITQNDRRTATSGDDADNGGARGTAARQLRARDADDTPSRETQLRPAVPGEFEVYVARVMGRSIPRFGASLLFPPSADFSAPPATEVPADYRLNPGDQLDVGTTGSVESDLHFTVNNDGRIFVPRIGAVTVAGVRYGELRSVLTRHYAEHYRDFTLSVTLPRLHGIRIFVTGFAVSPGSYTVNALTTLTNAVLAAGGPTGGGSFRSIEVRRNGAPLASFDLYDLLLHGDRSKDVLLQNGDVLYIAPVGPQVAITGSINNEAIYEAKPGETVGELIGLAGGLNSLADPVRAIVAQLSDLDAVGWRQLPLSSASANFAHGGDILRILSVADFARPRDRQAVLITIEGEVDRPGHYYLPPGARMADALAVSGGLTSSAFVFGTQFERSSVRLQQQRGFREALQELEVSLAAAPLTSSISDLDPSLRAAQLTAARAVVDRLRDRQPDGRVILTLSPNATALPVDLMLENNDRIYVPPKPTTVGVFGAVFRPGSFYLNDEPRRLTDYVTLAGGAQRIADKSEIFVVRANGEVVTRRRGGLNQPALPGDVMFVPVKTTSGSIWPKIRDIAGLLLSFGLGAAAIAAVTN